MTEGRRDGDIGCVSPARSGCGQCAACCVGVEGVPGVAKTDLELDAEVNRVTARAAHRCRRDSWCNSAPGCSCSGRWRDAQSRSIRLASPGWRRTQSIAVLVPKRDVVVDQVTVACTSDRPFGTLPNVDQPNPKGGRTRNSGAEKIAEHLDRRSHQRLGCAPDTKNHRRWLSAVVGKLVTCADCYCHLA